MVDVLQNLLGFGLHRQQGVFWKVAKDEVWEERLAFLFGELGSLYCIVEGVV